MIGGLWMIITAYYMRNEAKDDEKEIDIINLDADYMDCYRKYEDKKVNNLDLDWFFNAITAVMVAFLLLSIVLFVSIVCVSSFR